MFAANRILPLHAIAHHLVRELASLPMDATILLRKPAGGNPAAFEVLCAELAATLAINVEWHAPDTGHNRSGTYERDVSAVRACDRVIAYFHPDTPLQGGTGHLVERAIEEEVEVVAYVWEPDQNDLRWLGGNDAERSRLLEDGRSIKRRVP